MLISAGESKEDFLMTLPRGIQPANSHNFSALLSALTAGAMGTAFTGGNKAFAELLWEASFESSVSRSSCSVSSFKQLHETAA